MFQANDLKLIIQGETPDDIKQMRSDFVDYVRHVFGKGTDDYLAQINEYENERQHKLRKDHAIQNPWIVEELLRPIDNVWQAKGGDEVYTFTTDKVPDDFEQSLSDVRGGMSLQQFMKEIWFQRFVSDPNGVIFLEVSQDGSEAHFTYKSIAKIKAYKTKGVNLEWIVFEPDVEIMEDKDKKASYSWAVDKEAYYLCKNTGQEFAIIKVIEHTFGMVPGIVNSSIFDTDKGYKVSPIHKQLDLLNSYLVLNSVKEIYQFKHNFATPWAIEQVCPTCNGKRSIGNNEVCPTCHGSGKSVGKDVTDVWVIPKPQPDEPALPTPPFGYAQTNFETCGENRTELDWKFDKLYHSLWGTTVATANNETATGRFIDVMPVYNKLNMFADIAQNIHRQLAIIWGKYKYPLTFKDAQISYSRRYAIEMPDALWKRYQDAQAAKAPEMALNYMLEQFYYSEFASNAQMADYYVKLMYVEPYVHLTIEEVEALKVSENTKTAKRYFPDWQSTLEVSEVNAKTEDQLIADLYAFASKKKEDELNASGGEDIQKSALNGAQVTSLVEIMTAVTGGIMPKETAKHVIMQAFPTFIPETVDKMLNPIKVKPAQSGQI